MENIGKFLTFCEKSLGVPKLDLFQTVDLYEKQNMAQVLWVLEKLTSTPLASKHFFPFI